MNAEHTWADAPVMGHMFEEACYEELDGCYDSQGNLQGTMEMKPPLPTRLQWEFSSELVRNIDEAYSDGLKLVNVRIFSKIFNGN